MRRSVFLVFIIVVGCVALGAAPMADPTINYTMQKAMRFTEVDTKLHDVVTSSGGKVTTQFLLRPNLYQTCACTVEADFVVCACVTTPIGLCPEFHL